MLDKKNIVNELTPEQQGRIKKLELIINKFEDTTLKYGPASADELKNRINKIVRNFDSELKLLLEKRFDFFWNENKTKEQINPETIWSDADVPKFLRNYKK